jgi:cytochrome P450
VTDISQAEREAFISPLLLELRKPENRADPYSLYKKWREESPMHLAPAGLWTFTRYDDIVAVLRDDRFSVDPRNATAPEEFLGPPPEDQAMFKEMAGRILLFTDPPDHTRIRTLVSKAFTRVTIEQLRPHIEEIVRGLLDAAAERGELDVIEDFAYPLPALVICELMGVPVEDRDRFRGMSGDIAPILDPFTAPETLQKAVQTAGLFVMYFADLIEKRRADPQDDLLSALVAAEEAGEHLTMEELIGLCVLVFIAGHETTQNLIGNGLNALLRNRQQLELLRDDQSLSRNAIEELLRYDSPVQLTARAPTEDVVVSGETIKKGQEVVLLLGAGNRDPAQFDDPDTLDIKREKIPVISFGGGVHFCLGAPLARVEGQIAFAQLLQRFPNIELAEDEPRYRDTLTLRGLKGLKVKL